MFKRFKKVHSLFSYLLLFDTTLAFAGPVCNDFWSCLPFYYAFLSPYIFIVLTIICLVGWLLTRKRRIFISVIFLFSFGFFVTIDGILWMSVLQQNISDKLKMMNIQQRAIKEIKELPFNVYKINDVPEWTKRTYAHIDQDLTRLNVTFDLKRLDPNRCMSGSYLDDRWKWNWARIVQMKLEETFDYPNKCPSSKSIEYNSTVPSEFEPFDNPCVLIGTTAKGYKLYRSQDVIEEHASLSLQIEDTLIILQAPVYGFKVDKIINIVDSFTVFSKEELIKEQRAYYKYPEKYKKLRKDKQQRLHMGGCVSEM